MVGTALAGTGVTVALVNGVVAFYGWPLYVAAWSGVPLVMLFAQGVLALVALAVWITPEQRRDTRASVHPYRSSSTVVQISRYPDGRPAGLDLAPMARPPVGLLVVHVAVGAVRGAPPPAQIEGRAPGMVVPGEVVGRDDREGS